MKVVLLCAGYGTRLGKLTKKTPKPMINLGNKPLIGHIIDNLKHHGVHQIIVDLHYLPQQIADYVGDQALYYYEPELLDHKSKIFALREWLKDDDFMVINGDTWTNLNYQEMIKAYRGGAIMPCMDEWRCTGTWIYPKEYFVDQNVPVIPYRPVGLKWFDIGTPERLKKARAFFT